MPQNFVAGAAVAHAAADVPTYTNAARCNKYTEWQTRGTVRCTAFCASALSFWLVEAGFAFDPREHVWGERGDWNVTAYRVWAQKKGLWRPASSHPRAGWGVVMAFTMRDQHIGVATGAVVDGKIATIEGNTDGGKVLARLRYPANVQGYIAFDEAGQNKPNAPTSPQVVVVAPKTEENEMKTFYDDIHTSSTAKQPRSASVLPSGDIVLDHDAKVSIDGVHPLPSVAFKKSRIVKMRDVLPAGRSYVDASEIRRRADAAVTGFYMKGELADGTREEYILHFIK